MISDEKNYKDKAWGAAKLSEVKIFKEFSEIELEELYSVGEFIEYKKNTHVIVEGERTRGMFILLEGKVAIYKTDVLNNSLMKIANLEEGSMFGEISLLENSPRSATVSMDSRGMMFELSFKRFNKFLEDHGLDLQVRFYKACSKNLAKQLTILNTDYIEAEKLLWKYALRKSS